MTAAPPPRIEPREPPYPDALGNTLKRMMPPGIEPLKLFRTVAWNEHVLERFRTTGAYLLNFGKLEPIDREIVIHRTCARCGCEYEWGVHAAVFARQVGLSEEPDRGNRPGRRERSRLVAPPVPARPARRRAPRRRGRLRRPLGRARTDLGATRADRADRARGLLPPGLVRGERGAGRTRGRCRVLSSGGSPHRIVSLGVKRRWKILGAVVVVIAVLLAVNTIVANRDTEPAKADGGRIVEPAGRRPPGARGWQPAGPGGRPHPWLDRLDPLVRPAHAAARQALPRDPGRPPGARRLGEAEGRLLDGGAGGSRGGGARAARRTAGARRRSLDGRRGRDRARRAPPEAHPRRSP